VAGTPEFAPGSYPAVLTDGQSSLGFETVIVPLLPCALADVVVDSSNTPSSNWYPTAARGIGDPCSLELALTQVDCFDPATGDLIGTDTGPYSTTDSVVVGAKYDLGLTGCLNSICTDFGSFNPFRTTINPANVMLTFEVNGIPTSIGPFSVATFPPS